MPATTATTPAEYVREAEQRLSAARSGTEFDAVRREINSEVYIFGSDEAVEILDALPDNYESAQALYAKVV
jgi:hypothetical protein